MNHGFPPLRPTPSETLGASADVSPLAAWPFAEPTRSISPPRPRRGLWSVSLLLHAAACVGLARLEWEPPARSPVGSDDAVRLESLWGAAADELARATPSPEAPGDLLTIVPPQPAEPVLDASEPLDVPAVAEMLARPEDHPPEQPDEPPLSRPAESAPGERPITLAAATAEPPPPVANTHAATSPASRSPLVESALHTSEADVREGAVPRDPEPNRGQPLSVSSPNVVGKAPSGSDAPRRTAHAKGHADGSVGPVSDFFGIPVAEESVVFLVDASDSMREGDMFRYAAAELERSLDLLPPTSRFQIVLYSDRCDTVPVPAPTRASQGLLRNTAVNRRLAAQFVAARDPSGGTDHRAAFATALAARPHAIVWLTDAHTLDGHIPFLRDRLRRARSDARVSLVIFTIEPDRVATGEVARFVQETGGQALGLDPEAELPLIRPLAR